MRRAPFSILLAAPNPPAALVQVTMRASRLTMMEPPSDISRDFLERVSKTIAGQSLFRDGEVVLTACSGGVDSMALLDVLIRLSETFGITVVAAHLNHRLRGSEGEEDQRLVAQICQDRRVAFVGGSEDVSRFAKESGLSLQDAARRVRYQFLRKVLCQFEGDKIATAHHADDHIETVLMRLVRGTGPRGLRGIPIRREDLFVRPFLMEWKAEINSYADTNKIPFREDPGNKELHYQRNRIRNSLIPSLESYNPSIKEALYRMSTWVAEEGEAFDAFVDETLKRVKFTRTEREVTVEREKLIECQPPVIKEFVRRSMMELGVHYAPDSRIMAIALEFIQNAGSGKRLNLPEGLVLGRDFDELFLTRQENGIEVGDGLLLKVEIKDGWKCEFHSPGRGWRVEVGLSPAKEIERYKGSSFHQYFELDDVVVPLRVRKWRQGDCLSVFGMKGRKKVSDLLVDEKVPLRKRNDILVLEDGISILWVIGVRRGDRGKVRRGCGTIVSLSFEPL